MKKLPIGFSSLTEIIAKNCVYIDKTPHVYSLVDEGKYYFLSRPRRFGKSLLVDTLKQAFIGNEALFKGLYLESHWDWSATYPVIHIDLGRGVPRDRCEMERNIHVTLDQYFAHFNLESRYSDIMNRLDELIILIHHKTKQQVVILIDEYDKPILDNIDKIEVATEILEGLKNFYGVIKTKDEHLKFVLLTGVSKFSKVNLFSGLNNLNDISLNERYADICGYTQLELESAFHAWLPGVDKNKLRHWYNGYNFSGKHEQKVYNPFDILLFFSNGQDYQCYWSETGNPGFLLKLLEKNQYYLPQVEALVASNNLLNSFDIEQLTIEPLLFQTGYLTIKEKKLDPFDGTPQYQLDYPNHEVRTSLNAHLINYFITDKKVLATTRQQLQEALINKDFDQFKLALVQFFASIPYAWYTNNQLPHYEGFYASIIYSLLNAMGLEAVPEDTTNRGHIDLRVNVLTYYLIFEFKVMKKSTAQEAMQQIKRMKYPEKYAASGLPIYIMGIIFDEKTRNISDFAWEPWP